MDIFQRILKMFQFAMTGTFFLCLISAVSATSVTKDYNCSNPSYSTTAKKAYELVFDLRLKEARTYIERLKEQEPDNMLAYHIENISDFLILFINEDPKKYDQFKDDMDDRLEIIEASDASDPLYLYLQAEIELQGAIIHLKFGHYFKSFLSVRSSYKKLEENQSRFPDFIANKKSLGILHAILGTIPPEYKWGAELITGMEGTISQGQKELEEVLRYSRNNNFFFEKEAVAMYAILQVYLLNDLDKALEILEQQNLKPRIEPISCFILANIAMKQGNMNRAKKLLSERPQGNQYADFYYLEYMYGIAKLYSLDKTADEQILYFVRNYPGKNYLKEAYQKLAWHGLIFEDKETYQKYLDKVNSVGITLTDEDKAAQKESESGRMQNPLLLKARLLFDGGSYSRVIKMLNSHDKKSLSEFYQLEYTYRLARAYDENSDYSTAIAYYKEVISNGSKDDRYYACSSALHLGQIYEGDYNFNDAKKAFKLCLQISPEEYRASLHQKAKAGLKRIRQ